MNIYVSNLSFNIEDDDLRGFFEEYGQVVSAFVVSDKVTKRSKGFGFVEMSDDAAAARTIAEVDGAVADGRTIRVAEARPKEKKAGPGKRPFSKN